MSSNFLKFLKKSLQRSNQKETHTTQSINSILDNITPITICDLHCYFLEPIAEEIFEFFELCDEPFMAAVQSIKFGNQKKMTAIALAIYFIINNVDIDDFDDPLEFINICNREIKKMPKNIRQMLNI